MNPRARVCPPIITGHQILILELLAKRQWVRKEQIFAVLYENDPRGGPDAPETVLGVQLTKMRRKLRDYGIEIMTADYRGQGEGARYFLTTEGRERAKYFLAHLEVLVASDNRNQLELFAHA